MKPISENELTKLIDGYEEILRTKFPDQKINVGYYRLSNFEHGKFIACVTADNSIGNEDLDKYCLRHGIQFPAS